MADLTGHHFGNYQLVQLLGQGGQASVYLGKHRYLNSHAALKVLHARIRSNDERTFLSEAQRLVDLQHPNIVRLLDFCIEDGTPVLIMDYAPKGSVRQQYPQGTQMPLTTVVDFMVQIASALQYAHNHNVIHLGVSSGNSAPRRWKWIIHFSQVVQAPRALLVAVIIWLSFDLTIAQFFVPGTGLSVGLGFGLVYALISLVLSTQMEDIRPTERLRWSWRSLRRGLFNSRHLRIAVLFTCLSMIFVGRGEGLSQGLSVGLSIGLSYWCLLGSFQGIAQEQIEDQDRRIANQGIQRSLHNSVMMGLIGGAIIGSLGILTYWLTYWLTLGLENALSYGQKIELISGLSYVLSYGWKTERSYGLSIGLSHGLQLGICGALLIFLLTGGLAVLRHYTIRLLLQRSRTFPGRAPQFLDDAVARFLLRRVGGGYSFTHRLLLDHFVVTRKSDT